MAAVLACGDGAALSHFSAAVLWGHPRGPRSAHPRHGRETAAVAGASWFTDAPLAGERVTRQGILVTTPARTIVDLADVVTNRRTLERAIDEAEYLRLDWTGAAPRSGTQRQRAPLHSARRSRPGSTRTRRSSRRTSSPSADDCGFPRPEVNVPHRGLRVRFRLGAAAPDRRDRRRGSARHQAGARARSRSATPTSARGLAACCASPRCGC